MNPTAILPLAALLCASPAPGSTAGRCVAVEIRSDEGRALPFFSAPGRGPDTRVYAEAVPGQRYRIVVHNHLDRRVGLVIAVDGRNIISGQKSWLRPSERMYILGPGETQSYEGWRTSADQVNRFFFTDAQGSYAAAFGDESAMGLISVASYPEVRRLPPPRRSFWSSPGASGPGAADLREAPAAKAAPAPATGSARAERAVPRDAEESRAGTGYGPETYSPSVTVAFEAEATPLEKTFIKYEWREALVRLGVLRRPEAPRTRLWDGGYAPPPPAGW